jgi:hypothetical protein
VVFRCGLCGYVLLVYARVGQDSRGVPTPSEVIGKYGGVCPRCGGRLRRPSVRDVSVLPWVPGQLPQLQQARRRVVSFALPQPLYWELERLAEKRGSTVSDIVRQAVAWALRSLKAGVEG